jgi:hypothetical protein
MDKWCAGRAIHGHFAAEKPSVRCTDWQNTVRGTHQKIRDPRARLGAIVSSDPGVGAAQPFGSSTDCLKTVPRGTAFNASRKYRKRNVTYGGTNAGSHR